MSDSAKQIVEVVINNPKVQAAVTTGIMSNKWFSHIEPVIDEMTTVLGFGVLCLLFVKHILDIKRDHFTRAKAGNKKRADD